jgi:hypothetical protein
MVIWVKNWVSSCGLFGAVGVILGMECSVVFQDNVAEIEGGGLWKIVWGKKIECWETIV